MSNLQLGQEVAALRAEARRLAELPDISLEQDARLDDVLEELETKSRQLRAQSLADVRHEARGVQHMTRGELRDAALRLVDAGQDRLSPNQGDHVTGLLRRGISAGGDFDSARIAERIVLTENDDYRNGWMKLVTSPTPLLTAEESRAVRAFQDWQARTRRVP